MEKKYPFEIKSVEELVKEANEALRNAGDSMMTEEEEIKDDAEGGYFQDEDD